MKRGIMVFMARFYFSIFYVKKSIHFLIGKKKAYPIDLDKPLKQKKKLQL